jgi:hypothetical protein
VIPAPEFTEEQRQQLQARITQTLRAVQTALDAIAQAMANAAKDFEAVQEAFALAPPPEESERPCALPDFMGCGCDHIGGCQHPATPKEPTAEEQPARCEQCGATSQCPLHTKQPRVVRIDRAALGLPEREQPPAAWMPPPPGDRREQLPDERP